MPHWNALREAIDTRGLGALVADSGEKAAANLASEIESGRTIDNYDPLMAAHNAILGNAMNHAGPYSMEMLGRKEDGGHWCPICFLKYAHDRYCADADCPGVPDYEAWIDRAADEQVEVWKSMGTS